MVEVIVGAVVGSIATWLLPAAWSHWRKRRPVQRLRAFLHRGNRMRRLRAGEYVPNVSDAEYSAVLESPGLEKLHPQVRADHEGALRAAAERRRDAWIPRRPGWLARRSR